MIELESIEAIVAQYSRFGWQLRRIVSTDETENSLMTAFPDISVRTGEVEALWFSRANGPLETWELRRLTGAPFALLRVVEPTITETQLEEILQDAEAELARTRTELSAEIPAET